MAAKKKTTAKTKKKLSNMDQTHGKVDTFEPSTLEQIWGDDGLGKYSTLSESSYIEQLNGMAKVDMQAHATKVGLIPTDNVELMKTRLIKEFKKHVSIYRRPSHAPKNIKVDKEVKDILGEGK
jgi:hypothetical protein|tara:strand:+ start:249 stop:617 length:369 start_codon:yes stop_codon:yes gene_type:complete